MRKLIKPAHDDPDCSVDLFDADRQNPQGGLYCIAPAILLCEVEETWQRYVEENESLGQLGDAE